MPKINKAQTRFSSLSPLPSHRTACPSSVEQRSLSFSPPHRLAVAYNTAAHKLFKIQPVNPQTIYHPKSINSQ
jgi:hypothetical protein